MLIALLTALADNHADNHADLIFHDLNDYFQKTPGKMLHTPAPSPRLIPSYPIGIDKDSLAVQALFK
jgi:hypothetical protein